MNTLTPNEAKTDAPLMMAFEVGKKYSRSLKRSLWYGLKDMGRELLFRKEQAGEGWTREGEFWAVHNISFELRRGEALALIGANGAGKSTLLKMLSGLIKPDVGHIRVSGRTGALIELGAGFDPVLSGRENIYVSAAVLGLSRAEINEVVPKIIAFSELENYVDTPVKFYSSGMQARLSFAVASHLDPTVFLVDEVLAVGDIDFQRKCINHMLSYLASGGALILVSHSPYLIQSVCNRGIYIHEGRVRYMGTAIDALNCYLQKPITKETAAPEDTASADVAPERSTGHRPWRDLSPGRPVAIDEVIIEGIDGKIITTGEDARLTVKFRALGKHKLCWGFSIVTSDQWVTITGSANFTPLEISDGAQSLSCLIPKMPLLAGAYMLKLALMEAESRQPLALFGWEDAPLPFTVHSPATFLYNALKSLNQLMTIDVVWEGGSAQTVTSDQKLASPVMVETPPEAPLPAQEITLETAIERALDFLRRSQKPSGEFALYRTVLQGQTGQIYDSIPFGVALIASSLAYCDSPVARAMIDRACASLRQEMEPFGVWRHWPPPRPDCVMALPDLDDTAVVSAVLRRNGVDIPNNRGIMLANRDRLGLFHTWIIPRKVWTLDRGYWWTVSEKWRKPHGATKMWETEAGPGDIDAVVNSNVISYLGVGPETDAVCRYLIEIFQQGREESSDKWYLNRFVFYYAVARNYSEGFSALGVIRDEMIKRIVSSSAPDGAIGSGVLDTAQAACALLSLDANPPELDAAIRYLKRSQGPGGEWPYASYYFGGPKKYVAWGSEELTTAFCLQTLSRYARGMQL